MDRKNILTPGLVIVPANKSETGELHCKYVLESPKFKLQFAELEERELSKRIYEKFPKRSGGPLPPIEIALIDRNGETQRYIFEGLFNSYEILALGYPIQLHRG